MHEQRPSMTPRKAILKQVPTWTTPGSSAGEKNHDNWIIGALTFSAVK